MINFRTLKVKGFKSFVEPTEILIENGLTGIVGPNGCGKSNLVEAFRFVMGELSPKQMRGSELDDVIFNGTDDRPAWDIAEVSIDLDNKARKAPSIFNESDTIEVTRRIWRGEGSEYRVNGKEVRLKDVQLLFADAATGARSTSMVSQGRVGAIIAAKPEQRRTLLEEAAGITGLHSRRHEAELRLNATENNLERVKDVLKAQDEQLTILKKQSKQAERYKYIQKDITKARARLFYKKWIDEKDKLKAISIAGGCGANSVANGKITSNTPFEKVYIHPAPGDAGGAIGAALLVSNSISSIKKITSLEAYSNCLSVNSFKSLSRSVSTINIPHLNIKETVYERSDYPLGNKNYLNKQIRRFLSHKIKIPSTYTIIICLRDRLIKPYKIYNQLHSMLN